MEIKKNCNNCAYYGPEIGSICMNFYKHANWLPNERLQKKINIVSGSAMDVINKYIEEDINMTKTAYNYFFKNGDSIKTTHKIIFEKDHEMDIRDNIKDVIFNDPATIILWKDGSKTVVKAQEGELYDPEKGFAMAISKKVLGGQGNYYEVFKKWIPEKQKVDLNKMMNYVLERVRANVREVITKSKAAKEVLNSIYSTKAFDEKKEVFKEDKTEE